MAPAEKELENQLMEAGNRLLNPPNAVVELLPLLDVNLLFSLIRILSLLLFVFLLDVLLCWVFEKKKSGILCLKVSALRHLSCFYCFKGCFWMSGFFIFYCYRI